MAEVTSVRRFVRRTSANRTTGLPPRESGRGHEESGPPGRAPGGPPRVLPDQLQPQLVDPAVASRRETAEGLGDPHVRPHPDEIRVVERVERFEAELQE